MAVQTKVVRIFMAGAVAMALSGCVTVPDAIKDLPARRHSRIWYA